jgi:serine/threonine-protein kinase
MNDQAEAFVARARARIGQVLCEKWRIDGLLGVGGMAAVYAVTHVNNGRRAAIKLLHSELSATPEVRTRFLREGYVANKVDHPGTVAILDDHAGDDGTVFLVMELLEGETLEARRERAGTLPAHEVLSLADRLLDVLAAAHDKGIIHRDIKPENIFLTREGAVKVLDFGIARIRELSAARLTLTSAGAIGTPAFMPPEQARGRWDDVGPRSDLWAVGATMFTLLIGRLVHQAETVNELMLAAMTKHAPPVLSIAPAVPAPIAALVDRALAYDQNARWADARAMQNAVRAAYSAFDRASLPMAPPNAGVPAAQPPTAASGGATAEPVTMVGRLAPSPRFPVLPLVGGLAGAGAMGAVMLLVIARRAPAPPPSASTEPPPAESAAVDSAPGAPSAVTSAPANAAASASDAAAAVSATASPSASASGDAHGSSAAAKAKPPVVSRPRPGAAWPKPRH